jgi:hypothetical protein
MSDLDIDFFSIIYANFTVAEIAGWDSYAARVESGAANVRF